jgi:hypothetical protein
MLLRCLHLFIALNLLISSTGLNVYEHLCRMKGNSISIFAKADGCCSKKKNKTSCAPVATTQQGLKKKSCCEERSHYIKSALQGTSSFSQASHSPTLPILDVVPQAIPLLFASFTPSFAPFSPKIIRFWLYTPPRPKRDICVLVQTFLC